MSRQGQNIGRKKYKMIVSMSRQGQNIGRKKCKIIHPVP